MCCHVAIYMWCVNIQMDYGTQLGVDNYHFLHQHKLWITGLLARTRTCICTSTHIHSRTRLRTQRLTLLRAGCSPLRSDSLCVSHTPYSRPPSLTLSHSRSLSLSFTFSLYLSLSISFSLLPSLSLSHPSTSLSFSLCLILLSLSLPPLSLSPSSSLSLPLTTLLLSTIHPFTTRGVSIFTVLFPRFSFLLFTLLRQQNHLGGNRYVTIPIFSHSLSIFFNFRFLIHLFPIGSRLDFPARSLTAPACKSIKTIIYSVP